jgi:hypothetical protein
MHPPDKIPGGAYDLDVSCDGLVAYIMYSIGNATPAIGHVLAQ